MDKDVIYSDVSMKKYNSWRVGGLAEHYVEVSSEEALQKIFSINKVKKPITVIGVGSNLLIRDGGIKGTVINLSRGLKSIFYRATFDICRMRDLMLIIGKILSKK